MNKFKGKFGEILKVATEDREEKAATEDKDKKLVQPFQEGKAPIDTEQSLVVKRGRPLGKRSNPDFEQVTAYIRCQTYRQTKIALLQQDELSDFSELVEKLLTEWLSTQKDENSKT